MKPPLEDEHGGRYPVPLGEAQLQVPGWQQPAMGYEYSPGLRDLFEILLRRKWLILAFVIAASVLTLIYTLKQEPVYTAAGTIELAPHAPNVTTFKDMATDNVAGNDFMQTQIRLLTSRALAKRVIKKLHLEQYPIFTQPRQTGIVVRWVNSAFRFINGMVYSVTSTVASWFQDKAVVKKTSGKGVDLAALRKQQSLEGYFLSSLNVSSDGMTNILWVSFTCPDPTLARAAVNTLLEEFMSWQMDRRIVAAKAAKVQLEKQINVARSQLESSEAKLNRFAKQAGVVSLDSKLNLIYQELGEINTALANVESERIRKKEAYDQALKSDPNESPVVLNDSLIKKLRGQYIDLMAEYEQLRVTFKEQYPAVKKLAARMQDIGQKIKVEQKHILNSVENDYLATVNIEKALRKTATEKKTLALQLNELVSKYKILQREADTNKKIYESLLERSKQIDANVGTDIGNIKLVDLAPLPLFPEDRKLPRNLIVAIMLGLMAGVGVAFLLEHLDNTVKRIDEISDRHWIPILGVVPLADKQESKNLDSLVEYDPSSPFSESLRFVKASIKLSSSESNPLRSLLITSTAMGEGKTTIAANLAQAFAASHEKVLLIDTDMRRARLHRLFGSNGSTKGFSNYLAGNCKFEEIVERTEIPNLYFVAAGPAPTNPAGLLASFRLQDLMERLKGHFDRVILDAPPFGVLADVLYLGNQVDGLILVATLGQTHADAIRNFRKAVMGVDANLLGSIVNKFNIAGYSADYRNKYYRRFYSTYGNGDKSQEPSFR